jgi:hypothetical protein
MSVALGKPARLTLLAAIALAVPRQPEQPPGPGGDITEVQSFRCSKVNGGGFNLVTEID